MNKLLTISGPSCAGKTTLAQKLVSTYKNMEIVPTYTTRPLRDDDTHYIHTEEFDERDYIETNHFCSHWYGTKIDSLKEIWRDNKVAVKVIEPNGVRQLEKMQPVFNFRIVKVWLNTPRVVLEKRLQETGRERDLDKELSWYKDLNWNLVAKGTDNLEKLMYNIDRLLPTLANNPKMRVWQ